MNERIKELALEARLGPSLLLHHYGKVDALTDTEQEELEQIEKFAELIVKECIDKIQNYDLVPGHSAKWEDIYDIHARLLDDLGEELKENFGIEK
jgi:hypothetical protein